MPETTPAPRAARYGLAFLLVGAMLALRLSLSGVWGGDFPYLFFFPAVVLSALYGGLGPGLLAIALSAAAAAFYLLEPHGSLGVATAKDGTSLTGFCLVAGMMVLVADSSRRARGRAEAGEREAERVNAALRQSEERLNLALDAARMGVWEWDVAADALVWSPQLEAIHGQPPGTFPGTFEAFQRVIHPDDRAAAQAAIARALASGSAFTTEFRVPFPDGSLHWIAGEGSVLRDAAGKPVRMIGVGMDITARKEAEQELRARAEREATLNRIGVILRTSTDPQAIQDAVVSVLGEALRVDRCFFTLYDAAADLATVGRDWRRTDALPTLAGHYRLSDFYLDPTALYPDGLPFLVNDVRDDARRGGLSPETAAVLEGYGARALLSSGLLDGGVLTGSLTVMMTDEPREWTEGEVTLVQSVATQMRSAMEAARVHAREQRIAARLQDALRPRPAAVPGLDIEVYYQPALDEASIGGDFFDVFPLDAVRSAVVVADLSGKGLDAAAQVATVRHMLRAMLYVSPRVVEGVTALNDLLACHRLITGFATLFAGVYDQEARTLTYVSCGQEPGLLRRITQADIEELPPTGPILGAMPRLTFTERTVRLRPGDALVLFTDGLTESGPSRKELFGLEGVRALLAESAGRDTNAAALVGHLVAAVKRRARGALQDDACLLALVVKDPPPGDGGAEPVERGG